MVRDVHPRQGSRSRRNNPKTPPAPPVVKPRPFLNLGCDGDDLLEPTPLESMHKQHSRAAPSGNDPVSRQEGNDIAQALAMSISLTKNGGGVTDEELLEMALEESLKHDEHLMGDCYEALDKGNDDEEEESLGSSSNSKESWSMASEGEGVMENDNKTSDNPEDSWDVLSTPGSVISLESGSVVSSVVLPTPGVVQTHTSLFSYRDALLTKKKKNHEEHQELADAGFPPPPSLSPIRETSKDDRNNNKGDIDSDDNEENLIFDATFVRDGVKDSHGGRPDFHKGGGRHHSSRGSKRPSHTCHHASCYGCAKCHCKGQNKKYEQHTMPPFRYRLREAQDTNALIRRTVVN